MPAPTAFTPRDYILSISDTLSAYADHNMVLTREDITALSHELRAIAHLMSPPAASAVPRRVETSVVDLSGLFGLSPANPG